MSQEDIDKNVEEVLTSRKISNKITDIFNCMQTNESLQVPCIKGLERIFCSFLKTNEFRVDPNLKLTNEKVWEAEVQYVKWLEEVYEKTLKVFYEFLDSSKKTVKEQALVSILKLISHEEKYPTEKQQLERNGNKGSDTSLLKQRFQQIINTIISARSNNSSLISCFEKYLKFKDIFFYTWKCLRKMMLSITESSDVFILNILMLLEKISPPKKGSKKNGNEAPKFENEFFFDNEELKETSRNPSLIQKFMTTVWQNLINQKVSSILHRKLMVLLLEAYLPNLDNAIFFTDFFIASCNLGGANALLALQGILTLVQKYNMEYPNIYGKLYDMFEPDILHTKYRSRLFYLADIFLSSSHLPEKLVAAFAKRVARLILNAQVPVIVIGIRFIVNLLLRHPSLRKMVDSPGGEEVAEDPFLPEEKDPAKTRAIDSSLWELALLKNHVQPSVSSATNFIDSNLPTIEYDLSEVLDTKYEDVFEAEAKRKMKASCSISRPIKIAKLTDDRVYKLWALT